MGAAGVIAVMRMQEREVVDDFRAAGVISRDTARELADVGLFHDRALARLRDRAVIREAEPGRFYLDEEVWEAVRRTRRRVAFSMIFLILIVGFLFSIRFLKP